MLHRWSKIEWIHRSVLLILPLLFLAFTIYLNGSYGSLVDWVSQHIAFPDYFRKIFYEQYFYYTGHNTDLYDIISNGSIWTYQI